MGSISPSPAYGQRLLPAVVDESARNEPDRVLFYTPRNNQPSQGYEVITTRKFANAINRLCWWLESQVGSQSTPKTIGYIGQNDLRYFLLILSATKIGHKLLLSSPRNSVEGHLSLIKQSNCEFWITSSGVGKLGFLQNLQMPCFQVPALYELLDPSEVKVYPYEKKWHQGRLDILALLHTSGSTGLPRLIPITLEAVASGDALHMTEPINGKMPTLLDWTGTKMLCAMPLFHVAGLGLGLSCAVYFRWSVVLPPTGPVMQHVIEETLDNISLDSAFVSPSVLQDISKNPRVLEKFSKLKFVTAAGGPIPPSVGDVIHPRVSLWQTMGMTEGLWVPTVVTHPDEWAYFHFHPCSGYEMRPCSDTLFELVFVKKEKLAITQPIFMTFPDLNIYETKDLYSRHPTIPDLYKYETRKDDLVVLSNGEKFNPLDAEMQLAGHPFISAAYIAGRGRFQVAVLLNPEDDKQDESDLAFIETVWPTIEDLNQTLPAFAQIHRDFVKVVRTPFPRTPKGTLARYGIETIFAKDIDDIYQTSVDEVPYSFQIDGTSEEAVRDGIREAIQTVSSGGLENISDNDNIFGNGFDSLHVIRLSRLLSSAFPSFPSPVNVQVSTIYANPSISQLGNVLWMQLHQGHQEKELTHLPIRATSQMLAKHLQSFEISRKPKEYVVLTGTTGAIGSYLLDVLCKNDSVAKVWCFNRSNNASHRQAELAQSRGLSLDWKGKVRFIQTDLVSEALGLSQADLEEIKDQATIIIHNAWEVNFNLPLPSFETQFLGLWRFINICTETRNKINFFFVSSISAAMNWPSHVLGPVPETKIANLDAPVNGYGASKLVAEHLLSKAAQSGVLRLSVLRVGQVAGPVKTHGEGSIWTRRDWVPAIIDSSAYLRKLPSDLGSATALDWIPIDILAEVIGQLISSDVTTGSRREEEMYYNLVNPKMNSWEHLLPGIRAHLEKALSDKVHFVSFREWIDCLQGAEESIVLQVDGKDGASSGTANRAQTGLKLLSFFRMLAESNTTKEASSAPRLIPNWAVSNTLARSSVFADLAPVSPTWFETWLDQWGY